MNEQTKKELEKISKQLADLNAQCGLDKATAALVYSSIPTYRNSDRCPAKITGNYPGECGRTMNFVQAALVCPEHGPVPVRGR